MLPGTRLDTLLVHVSTKTKRLVNPTARYATPPLILHSSHRNKTAFALIGKLARDFRKETDRSGVRAKDFTLRQTECPDLHMDAKYVFSKDTT